MVHVQPQLVVLKHGHAAARQTGKILLRDYAAAYAALPRIPGLGQIHQQPQIAAATVQSVVHQVAHTKFHHPRGRAQKSTAHRQHHRRTVQNISSGRSRRPYHIRHPCQRQTRHSQDAGQPDRYFLPAFPHLISPPVAANAPAHIAPRQPQRYARRVSIPAYPPDKPPNPDKPWRPCTTHSAPAGTSAYPG